MGLFFIAFPSEAISFQDSGGSYAFQDNEKTLLQSMMGMLPAEDLTGITTIRAVADNSDGVFDTLLPGGVIQLALPPSNTRSTDGFYPLLPYHLTDAIGQNVYNSAMTGAERQEWVSLVSAGQSPVQRFGQAYSLWTLSSNDLISQALAGSSTATASLAQAIFVSSLFLTSSSNLTGYAAVNLQNNLFQPGNSSLSLSYKPSTQASDGLLKIGSFDFIIRNNAIVSWSSENGISTVLQTPVPLPATWLSRYAVTLLPPSPVKVNAVVSAASFISSQSMALAAGSYATLFGANLAGKTVSITMNGITVSNDPNHYFGNDTQINFQIPAALGSATSAQLVVTVDGQKSPPATVALGPVSPAIFRPGITNPDGSVNAPSDPTAAGGYASIYVTGLLPANGSPHDVDVSAFVGGRQVDVLYAGPPGGLAAYDWYQQVNIAIPADMPVGTQILIICATPLGGIKTCSRSSLSDPVPANIYIGPPAEPSVAARNATVSQKSSAALPILSEPPLLRRSSSRSAHIVIGDAPSAYIPLNSGVGRQRLQMMLEKARKAPDSLPSLDQISAPYNHPVIQS